MPLPHILGRGLAAAAVMAAWILIRNLDARLPAMLPPDAPLLQHLLHLLLGSFLWLGMAWLLVQLLVHGIVEGALVGILRRRVPGLVKDLLRVVIYGAAVAGILKVVLGLPVGGVLATTGLVGVVLGFALRDMIADVFSGIAINLEEPYLIGDTIGLEDGFIGRVVEITWRTTRLVSADEITSVVPNGRIGAMAVRNYSQPAQPWRAQVEVILGHEVPVSRAQRVLEAALRGVDEDINRRRAQAQVLKVDELGVHYMLFYWVTSIEEWSPLRTRVLDAAMECLYHAGIAPVRPRPEVSLRRVAVDRIDETATRRLQLARIELLHELDDAELTRLAGGLTTRSAPPGTRVVREGDDGESLFLVLEGLLEVSVAGAGGVARIVGSLRAGEYFGEFSLLTPEARSASVDAVTECRLLEIGRAALEPLLKGRPELATLLSRRLAERRLASRMALDRASEASPHHRHELAERLLAHIRAVFHLERSTSVSSATNKTR